MALKIIIGGEKIYRIYAPFFKSTTVEIETYVASIGIAVYVDPIDMWTEYPHYQFCTALAFESALTENGCINLTQHHWIRLLKPVSGWTYLSEDDTLILRVEAAMSKSSSQEFTSDSVILGKNAIAGPPKY